MFTGSTFTKVTWADGDSEEVDAMLPTTGHRPDLGHPAPLDALERR